MRPIQSQAPAFLNLLGLKSKGALPPELVEVVQPQVDMLGFYLRGGRQISSTFQAGPGTMLLGGFVAVVPVPDNEWWHIEWMTARLNWGALPSVSLVATNFGAAVFAPGIGAVRVGRLSNVTGSVGTSTNAAAPAMEGLWAPPGSLLGLWGDYIDIADGGGQTWGVYLDLQYTPVVI